MWCVAKTSTSESTRRDDGVNRKESKLTKHANLVLEGMNTSIHGRDDVLGYYEGVQLTWSCDVSSNPKASSSSSSSKNINR